MSIWNLYLSLLINWFLSTTEKSFTAQKKKLIGVKPQRGLWGGGGGGGYSGLQVTGMIKGLFWVFLGVLGEILQNFKG